MKRFLWMAFCALLGVGIALVVEAQRTRGGGTFDQGKGTAKGGGGGNDCIRPAACQANQTVFNFGRTVMNETTPPVHSNSTISVTCTRVAVEGLRVQVHFELWPETVQDPPRAMRDIGQTGRTVAYDMFVDPARTRPWGSTETGQFPFTGTCFLDNQNRVCTLPFLLYGTTYGRQSQTSPGKYQGALVTRLNYRFTDCIS